MQSPFPGMDPYIEATDLWEDFHSRLLGEIYGALVPVLPRRYIARTAKRSYKEHFFSPDVKITEPRSRRGAAVATLPSESAAAIDMEAADLRADVALDFEEKFIDIYELRPERRLVTSIEVLSPSNKRRGSEGWQLYLRKRQSLLLGMANLVEIDLVRGGDRMPMLDPWPASPYALVVARRENSLRCRVWPAYFDRPLPKIPIPLSKPDADLQLDLQPLIAIIYERGRYGDSTEIDYTKPLQPPLTAEQAAWLEERLREATKPRKQRAAPKRRRQR